MTFPRYQEDGLTFRFVLADYDRAFATRGKGNELRELLLQRAEGADRAIVDFVGVSNVSHSFADEFVGKLCHAPLEIELVNMAPAIARRVERAVDRRKP